MPDGRLAQRSGSAVSEWSDLLRAHEDAEGVPVGVGVHVQRLSRVVEAVLEKPGTKPERTFVLCGQRLRVGHDQVEVELLGRGRRRPGGGCELRDLLKGQVGGPAGAQEHEPIAPVWVIVPGRGGFVPLPVLVAEQLTVELGGRPRIGRVEDDAAP